MNRGGDCWHTPVNSRRGLVPGNADRKYNEKVNRVAAPPVIFAGSVVCAGLLLVSIRLRNHPEGFQAISRRSRSAPPNHSQGHAHRPPKVVAAHEAARPGANGYDPFRIGARGLSRRAKVNHRLAQLSCQLSIRMLAKKRELQSECHLASARGSRVLVGDARIHGHAHRARPSTTCARSECTLVIQRRKVSSTRCLLYQRIPFIRQPVLERPQPTWDRPTVHSFLLGCTRRCGPYIAGGVAC
jgi:hypothetical protein